MTTVALASYVAVASTRFRTLLQYRVAALAGIATQIFWGLLKLMVLGAFYEVATTPPPMSFEAIVVYVWLGQCLFVLLPYNIDPDLREMFRSGSVAYEMLRPLSLYWHWFSRTLAFRTAPALLRLIPGLAFALIILRLIGLDQWVMPLPASGIHALAFAVSIGFMVVFSVAFQMLVNASMFWLMDSRGMVNLSAGFVMVLCGMIIPLPLFPDWLQPFLYWQPFRALCDIPFRIYSGDIPVDALISHLALQCGWSLAFIGIGITLLNRAQRQLVVQGG